MEEFFKVLDKKQKAIIDDLLLHVEKRTNLKPVIMFSIPAFKITNDVMLAFDITKTYLGLYTTDQHAINCSKPRFDTALFGVCTVKVDYRYKKNIDIIKDICDDVIMHHMAFNATDLIKALDDPNHRYRDLAYEKILEIIEENLIHELDFKFFLYHEKKDYVLKGIGMVLKALEYDKKHDYDKHLIDYLKVLDHPLISVVSETFYGLQIWIYYKPYLKQTIKTYIRGVDFSRFKPHQIEKIQVEIEKIKAL